MRIQQYLAISVLFYASLLPILTSASVLQNNTEQPLSAEQNKNQPLSSANKKSLLHLLKQDCGSCHGMTLKGGLGPALLPENLINKPTLFIKNTILFGRPGTAMPPWKGLLTEQEALWLTIQLQQGISHE